MQIKQPTACAQQVALRNGGDAAIFHGVAEGVAFKEETFPEGGKYLTEPQSYHPRKRQYQRSAIHIEQMRREIARKSRVGFRVFSAEIMKI